jgi:dTMP kinase
MIHALDRLVTSGMRPDRTILFDIDPASGVARAHGRNRSSGLEAEARFENEKIAFHERVRAGYLTLSRTEPSRIRVVDASPSPEEVQRTVRTIVDEMLFKGE